MAKDKETKHASAKTRFMFKVSGIAHLVLFFFNCFNAHPLLSQTSHTLTLHFESNTYTLSPENTSRIDSVINLLNNTPAAYEVEIEGHSDTTGLWWLNKSISQQRARQAFLYLEAKGFSRKSINASAKGSSEPIDVNSTETGKAHNRRVTLVIRLNLPDINNLAGISLSDEKFTLPADSGGIFFDTSGTVIKIPPDAFVDENGQPVTGNIDFSYQEYRDPLDLILSGLPMHQGSGNNREYFNSYGMFKLKAYHNGKPVFLKKDKQPEVDFAMTRQPKYADIFQFDSLSKRWKKPSRVENDYLHYLGPICGGSGGGSRGRYNDCYCRMNDCVALDFLIKTIQSYAGEGRSIYADFWRKDTLHIFETLDSLAFYNQHCPRIHYKIDTLAKRIKMDQHTYKVTNLKRGLRKLKFSIKCQSRKKNEFGPLKTISWKCPSAENPGVFSKLNKHKWTYCHISRSETGFTIQLSDSTDQIELKGVRGVTKERMSKTRKKVFLETQFAEYEALRLPYHTHMKELDDLKALLYKQFDACKPMRDSLYKRLEQYSSYYCKLQKDNIFCFWQANRHFMPLAEKELLFTHWLRYFDAHEDEMEARVVQVRTNTRYLSCLHQAQRRKRTIGELPDKPAVAVATPSLGTYHVAEVVKLHDTVLVYATYTDTDGNTIEPVIVYLTDKTVNTAIRYDGTDTYSPYKFRLSPTTVKALLAIDKKGGAYLCTPEHLRGIVVNGRQLTHTFVIRKLPKFKSKEELLKLLEYDATYAAGNPQTESKKSDQQ